MELKLYREDVRPEYRALSTPALQFQHFTERAQAAIRLTGSAVYYECDRWNSYNAILPPKDTDHV